MVIQDNQINAALKPASHFFTLPPEIRNSIYDYALDWPDMTQPFEKSRKDCMRLEQLWVTSQRPRCVFLKPRIEAVTTPTILLLNRQIYHEAINVLHGKPLMLVSPPPHSSQLGRALDITEFIGEATLQNVAHVVLKVNLEEVSWPRTLKRLLEIWDKHNRLKSLRIGIEGIPNLYGLSRGHTFGRVVADILAQLKFFGLKVPVTLEGEHTTIDGFGDTL